MSSLISSQGVVFATALVVSSTVIFLAFSKQKATPLHEISEDHDSFQSPDQNPRSCLRSEGKKRKERKKKKRVRFAEDVKDKKGVGEDYRKEKGDDLFGRREKGNSNRRIDKSCRNEIPGSQGMPANRIALYNGILRDRVLRIECSY